MKTLCVAVVVLSLTSVCQPASLACEKLLKPADKGPDISGRWHHIAMASDICLVPVLVKAVLWPSIVLDITAKDTPKIYDGNFKINMYGYCYNESESFFYENNMMSKIDSNNVPTGKPDLLLQSGCPDCLVLQEDDDFKTLMLYSRRKNVTAAELREFEAQVECLGWAKPQLSKLDHDYENCKTLEDNIDTDHDEISSVVYERVKNMREDILKCIIQFLLSYVTVTFFEK